MATKLPFFPLKNVVFPYESLNLHVFEPRYRQLIHDCETTGIRFGIPAYIDDKIGDFGTEIQLQEIVNAYSDGRLDIKTKGTRLFKVLNVENPMGGKLYAGGEVEFIDIVDDATESEKILVIEKAMELYKILGVRVEISYDTKFLSYKIGHKVGFNFRQEYAMLQMHTESERIRFMTDHLSRSIPVLRDAEKTKKKIQMNGHFKNFDPLDF
ncbi:MAG: LON peptidase substrate-binding domain-containing protein [Flammeovirgaceae bacterium]